MNDDIKDLIENNVYNTIMTNIWDILTMRAFYRITINTRYIVDRTNLLENALFVIENNL